MVELKVLESYTRDIGRSVARIDYASMDALNLSTGDYAIVTGKRDTVLKILPLYPSDEGKGISRIDGLDRNNMGCVIQEMVKFKKTEVQPAQTVVFKPLEAIPPIDERYLSDCLDGIPVTKGKYVMVPYFGGRISFEVIKTVPNDVPVIIHQKTMSVINENIAGSELLDIEERLVKELEKIKTDLLDELKKLNEDGSVSSIKLVCHNYINRKKDIEEVLALVRNIS